MNVAAHERWRERVATAADAVALVRPGDRVFIGTGCAAPVTLLDALERSDRVPAGVRLVHVILSGELPEGYLRGVSSYRHEVLFIGSWDRALMRAGCAEYVPVSLAEVPAMMRDGRFPIDVALVQAAPPDADEMCSLGVSIDVTKQAVECADRVIAELNPALPRTHGDTRVPVTRFDRLVEVPPQVTEYVHEPIGDVGRQIARYVARIIPDGATLQVGLGRVANEMLGHLRNRRDMGVHSDVITEPLVDLIEEGIVTGARKSVDKGLVVASWAMGTRRLYDLLDDNPAFQLRLRVDRKSTRLNSSHYSRSRMPSSA